MVRLLGGCVAKAAALLLLGGLIAVAWFQGPRVWDRIQDGGAADGAVPSAALAAETVERYEGLVEGREERITVGEPELQSLLLYRLSDRFPEGVTHPAVRLADGELRLEVRIALAALPPVPELERIRGILPDPVPVDLRGSLVTLGSGEAIFMVRRVDAAGIPLPRRFLAALVETLDPGDREGLPTEAVRLPLPDGVGAAYIQEDRLVLERAS